MLVERLHGPLGQGTRLLTGLARPVYLFHSKKESMNGCGKASMSPNPCCATNGWRVEKLDSNQRSGIYRCLSRG